MSDRKGDARSYLSFCGVTMGVYKRILRPQTVGPDHARIGVMPKRHPRSDYAGVTVKVAAFRPGQVPGFFIGLLWVARVVG